MSSDKAISKCASQLAGVSPSKFDWASSKNPALESNVSSKLSDVWVIEAVTLEVYISPKSTISANS